MWSLAKLLLYKTCFENRAFVPKVPKLVSYPPCEPRKISFDDHMWLVIKGMSHKVGQGGGSAEERGKEHSM